MANISMPSASKLQLLMIFNFEIILIVLYVFFTVYERDGPAGGMLTRVQTFYSMFQDVHVMIFVGFGFLMTFLRRYGYSSVGFNLLLAAVLVQWAVLCIGFFDLDSDKKIRIGVQSILEADIASATALISMGAVLGKTTYLQLIVMGIFEVLLYAANKHLGVEIFKVADAGESIFVHVFGAYFGLAVSFAMRPKKGTTITDNDLEGASYNSDMFAMIGTLFLWLFWPSFNAASLSGDAQQRAIINTYLSLAACTATAYATSALLSHERRLEMAHIQNATLAGGVAVGAVCNLFIQPFGALIIGAGAGVLSVVGFTYITPWLRSKGRLHDTCGVHNLHGMPGVLAGLISVLMAAIATEEGYGKSALYEIYPAREAASVMPLQTGVIGTVQQAVETLHGENRTAATQALFQLIALLVTIAVAIVGGAITGKLISLPYCGTVDRNFVYSDEPYWILPDDFDESNIKQNNDITTTSVSEPKQIQFRHHQVHLQEENLQENRPDSATTIAMVSS